MTYLRTKSNLPHRMRKCRDTFNDPISNRHLQLHVIINDILKLFVCRNNCSWYLRKTDMIYNEWHIWWLKLWWLWGWSIYFRIIFFSVKYSSLRKLHYNIFLVSFRRKLFIQQLKWKWLPGLNFFFLLTWKNNNCGMWDEGCVQSEIAQQQCPL